MLNKKNHRFNDGIVQLNDKIKPITAVLAVVCIFIFCILSVSCIRSGEAEKPELSQAYKPLPKIEPEPEITKTAERTPAPEKVTPAPFTPIDYFYTPDPSSIPEDQNDIPIIGVESSAFNEGGFIPVKYTGYGEDVSPPLYFKNIPPEAKSLVVICEDLDAFGGIWTHWIIFNIDPSVESLNENISKNLIQFDGSRQGVNDFSMPGYNGPKPPSGRTHRYIFRVFALSEELSLAPGIRRADLMEAMDDKILAKGSLMGMYGN